MFFTIKIINMKYKEHKENRGKGVISFVGSALVVEFIGKLRIKI